MHETTRKSTVAAAFETRPVVAIYLRISDDKKHDEAAVARQLEDSIAIARARGWAWKVYKDNDLSAYKRNVIRPEFEQMVKDLRAGILSGVIAYDLDRLWRQPMDLERVIEIYETRRGLPFVTLQVDLDLSTSDGQFMARVLVAGANKASADTARRVKRKAQEIQENGKPGGGPRPFGFKDCRIKHDKREARLLREAAAYLLDGGSLSTLVERWREKGIKTTRGNDFTPISLRKTLRNPRNVGMRCKWDKAARDWVPVQKEGHDVIAVWEPIFDRETFDALAERFSGTTFQKGQPRESTRKHLLTGIARCGACGHVMQTRSPGKNGRGSVAYSCPVAAVGGCGKVARVCYRVDALVTEAVLTVLQADLAGAHEAPGEWEGEAELERLTGLIGDMWEEFKAGRVIDKAAYFRERGELEGIVKTLKEDKKAHARTVAAHEEAVDVAAHWEAASLVEKRAAIRSVFATVVIDPIPAGPNGSKSKTWNPELVRLIPA